MNHYEILNVAIDASISEITIAHKKLAMKLHPDRNNGNKNIEEQFKKVNKAYTILSNSDERSKYDIELKDEKENVKNFQNNHNFGSSPPKKQYISNFENFTVDMDIKLNFWDAIKGGAQEINFYFNEVYYNTTVEFPPGIDSGYSFKVSSTTHDFNLIIKVEPDEFYYRDGLDLYAKVTVPLHIAMLGGKVNYPHFKDVVAVNIPKETQNGDIVKCFSYGVSYLGRKGNLYLKCHIDLPKKITAKQKELIQEFAIIESTKETGIFFIKTSQFWKNIMSKFNS